MRRPPVTVPAGRSLREALALMMAERISSVFVAPPPDSNGPPDSHGPPVSHGDYGILTEHDIHRTLDAGSGAHLDDPFADHASTQRASVERDEFVQRALAGCVDRCRGSESGSTVSRTVAEI